MKTTFICTIIVKDVSLDHANQYSCPVSELDFQIELGRKILANTRLAEQKQTKLLIQADDTETVNIVVKH